MENMIKKIVDADNEARAMEENIKKEKGELSQKIDSEAQAIYDKYMSEALETIKRNDAAEEKNAAQQWEEVKGKQKSAHIKLQSDYKNNCALWVHEFVKRVIDSVTCFNF